MTYNTLIIKADAFSASHQHTAMPQLYYIPGGDSSQGGGLCPRPYIGGDLTPARSCDLLALPLGWSPGDTLRRRPGARCRLLGEVDLERSRRFFLYGGVEQSLPSSPLTGERHDPSRSRSLSLLRLLFRRWLSRSLWYL